MRHGDQFTIEIEHAEGKAINMDRVRAALEKLDIKVKTTAEGSHLCAISGLKSGYERMGDALRMAGVLPYEDEKGGAHG